MEKLGMTQTPYVGKSIPTTGNIAIENMVAATWLICEKLFVLGHKTKEREGYNAMILGFGSKKLQKINKAQRYLSVEQEQGFGPEKVYEYKTDELMPIGSFIDPTNIFPEGSYVDVQGYTKGRGFSGVMKAWNFHGGRASHGTSKAHRTPGSSGGKRGEGRVMPGKKMPKNYGNEKVTIQNIRVVFSQQVEFKDKKKVSLIGIDGGVPGCNSRLCYLKKAIKKGSI